MRDEEKQRNYELAERLISEQKFAAAAIAGAIATLLSAVAYGIVVERWLITYGFAAAGVGIVVGFFMGFLGRGISTKFSVLAAVYTIAGCILGNLFVKIWNRAQAPTSSFADVFQDNTLSDLARWSVSGLTFIHLVFWFVAVVAAVFLAKRSLSRSERLALGLYEARA
jgi:ribose/xylose/arabinose/galactoside ABC-type transport system permease subunit